MLLVRLLTWLRKAVAAAEARARHRAEDALLRKLDRRYGPETLSHYGT